jgi:acyl carrier protein
MMIASASLLWNYVRHCAGHVGIIFASLYGDMSRQDILMELEKLMELERGTLTGSESLDNLPTWDSLAILTCIAVFQQRTGVVLDGEMLSQARTVNDLVHIVPGASEPAGSG